MAPTSNTSQGLSMRPIASGAQSQSKAASNAATTAVATGVRWMVRKDTRRFSTRAVPNRSGKRLIVVSAQRCRDASAVARLVRR